MNPDTQTSHAVVAEGLGKRYDEQWALREFDLAVPTGSVLGLLGHNGAGKTTAIRILTTLVSPTEGTAKVAGHDVLAEPDQVREQIGLTSQAATVDGLMSGAANLEMIGRLYHLPRKVAKARATELLAELRLEDAGDRLVRDYSGGMRRRLDLAASLVASPPVLFLDEPTTGLDPESRNELWDLLRQLVGGGTTLILTTQYLEEADQLADDVVLLDHGKIVATGSPSQLKAQHGGERVVVTVDTADDLGPAAAALEKVAAGRAEIDREELLVTAPASESTRLIEVVRALEDGGVDAHDVRRREATLDDVFFSLTSPRSRAASAPAATAASSDTDQTDREEAAA
jgi:ABC-2 type transport system ATP-binding protein